MSDIKYRHRLSADAPGTAECPVVTEVRLAKNPTGNWLGYCDVSIGYLIRDVKINRINNKIMPQLPGEYKERLDKQGTPMLTASGTPQMSYCEHVHPVTAETRRALVSAVEGAYQRACLQQIAQTHEKNEVATGVEQDERKAVQVAPPDNEIPMIIDPVDEYSSFAKALHGQVIKLSPPMHRAIETETPIPTAAPEQYEYEEYDDNEAIDDNQDDRSFGELSFEEQIKIIESR